MPETDLEARFLAARNGSTRDQEELFRALVPPLRRVIHRRLGEDARSRGLLSTGDILSETLWELCRKLPTFDGKSVADLIAYACRVVTHRIQDAAKAAHRERRDVRRALSIGSEGAADPGAHDPSPSQELLGAEMQQRIEAALARLAPRERTLIQMKRSLDAGPTELAEFLGFSSSDAARMALQRATAKLFRLLDEPAA